MCQGRRRGEGLTVQHGGPHVSVLFFPLLFLLTAEAASFLSSAALATSRSSFGCSFATSAFDININSHR